MLTQFIPSPSEGVWYLGPLPLRGYALCIIAGIVAAVWIGERRWAARGGTQGEVTDIALWAVPFGVVGGRLYHVITDHDLYFGDGRSAINALYVWRGGLGIWAPIALGGVRVWIGAHRKGIRVPPMLDVLAPGGGERRHRPLQHSPRSSCPASCSRASAARRWRGCCGAHSCAAARRAWSARGSSPSRSSPPCSAWCSSTNR